MRAELSEDPQDRTIEPLFAHSGRLWLRVWGTTQVVILIIAAYVMVDARGGVTRLLATPSGLRTVGVTALLALYHATGLVAHRWILQRTWAVLIFVPLGWVVIIYSLSLHGVFGLLVLGAILQGFIFLSFGWAMATLAIAILTMAALVATQNLARPLSVVLGQVGGLLAMGIVTGTVLLYIHRTNQEAAIRARLLRQLDEAQRGLAERARDAGAQEERQRLARDIHDTLAQGFTSVIKHLEAIELSFAAPGHSASASLEAATPHLRHAHEVSRTSLAEIRRLVWALTPAALTEAPLGPAIQRIVTQWGEANAVLVSYTSDPLPALQPDADVIFLRAAQESLSNVARHAGARRVHVSFSQVDGLLLLTIEDDGRGFVHADAVGVETMGLSGMRDRVRRFGGHVLIESTVGSGTSLTVALPLASIVLPEREAS